MISPLYSMQSSLISAQNMSSLQMMQNVDAIRFGASQPLRPSFAQTADVLELQNKAHETKLTVAQNLLKAIEEALGKNISRTTPKYSGLDYKA